MVPNQLWRARVLGTRGAFEACSFPGREQAWHERSSGRNCPALVWEALGPANPGWAGFRGDRKEENRMLHPPHHHLGYIFGYVNFPFYTLQLKLIPGAAASQHSLLQCCPPSLLSLIFPSASCDDAPSQRNTGAKIGKISTVLPSFPDQGTVTTGYCTYSCTK